MRGIMSSPLIWVGGVAVLGFWLMKKAGAAVEAAAEAKNIQGLAPAAQRIEGAKASSEVQNMLASTLKLSR